MSRILFDQLRMKKIFFHCCFEYWKRSNFFVLQRKIIPHIDSFVCECVFIIICSVVFFVKQRCVSCVIIMDIFVGYKIIRKNFWKIIQMEISEHK